VIEKTINRIYQRYCTEIFCSLMKKYLLKIACAFLGLMLVSCNDEAFEIGGHLVDPKKTFGTTDTVTIRVSNLVASDSVITLARQIGFSGKYHDEYIGTIKTKTFIEFNRTVDREDNRQAMFDSITLVIRPNGSYFGDTLKLASFKVFELAQQIERREGGSLYSTSTVPLGDMLADTAVRVRVGNITNNEIEITLPREFGERLFDGILRDEEEYNRENFVRTFPGLAIGPGTGSNCIHGFFLNDTATVIRIYYNITTTFRDNKVMTFNANSFNSFYHLSNDKSEISEQFDFRSDPVPSSRTGNMGYIMSGTPMFTRLEFPHLNELMWLGQTVIIERAILFVRPIQHSFDMVPLPPRLNLYPFDPTSNIPLRGAITAPARVGGANMPQHGNLPLNYQNISLPQYTFDITDFIVEQLGRSGHNKWALSLIIPFDSRENTIQRLVFGNQDFWYKSENQSRDNRIILEIDYTISND